MKRSFAGLVVLALVAAGGCNQGRGTPGGPRAADSSAKKPLYGQADDTFTLGVPTLSTTLKQGEAKAVSLTVKRGRNFDEDVSLSFADLPKGVSLDPARHVIKHGDTEAKVTLKAADDASLGDFTVKVTGRPTKGADAENEFTITVGKK